MSSSLKMAEIKEGKGAAEAHAIYQGGAAGGINVASKDDEVKVSVGLDNKFLSHCSTAYTCVRKSSFTVTKSIISSKFNF